MLRVPTEPQESNHSVNSPAVAAPTEDQGPTDAALLERCRSGDELAWRQLIYRYRRLIYSIPIRFHFSPEAAADVFQEVCLKLLSNLASIRPDHLRGWLSTVTRHECIHRNRPSAREGNGEDPDSLLELASDDDFARQMELEQAVREAVAQLSPRCQFLIQMLFYDQSELTYATVAERLGVAKNSVGFLRNRCLDKLEQELKKIGFLT